MEKDDKIKNNESVAKVKLEWDGGTSLNLQPLPTSFFEVTITNLAKEQRYFYEPRFKLSILDENNEKEYVSIQTKRDTSDRIEFPIRLERGQPISIGYTITGEFDSQRHEEARMLKAKLQASVKTTLDEESLSNECPFFSSKFTGE
jgi:hypothetical protein